MKLKHLFATTKEKPKPVKEDGIEARKAKHLAKVKAEEERIAATKKAEQDMIDSCGNSDIGHVFVDEDYRTEKCIGCGTTRYRRRY